MNVKKVLSTVAYIVVVVAVVLGFKFYNMGEAAAETKSQVLELVREVEDYDYYKEYYESLVEANHDEAFRHAYDMGGRRRAAEFNERKYVVELFALMIAQAEREERERPALNLKQFRGDLLNATLEP